MCTCIYALGLKVASRHFILIKYWQFLFITNVFLKKQTITLKIPTNLKIFIFKFEKLHEKNVQCPPPPPFDIIN